MIDEAWVIGSQVIDSEMIAPMLCEVVAFAICYYADPGSEKAIEISRLANVLFLADAVGSELIGYRIVSHEVRPLAWYERLVERLHLFQDIRCRIAYQDSEITLLSYPGNGNLSEAITSVLRSVCAYDSQELDVLARRVSERLFHETSPSLH